MNFNQKGAEMYLVDLFGTVIVFVLVGDIMSLPTVPGKTGTVWLIGSLIWLSVRLVYSGVVIKKFKIRYLILGAYVVIFYLQKPIINPWVWSIGTLVILSLSLLLIEMDVRRVCSNTFEDRRKENPMILTVLYTIGILTLVSTCEFIGFII
ncbi:MAG: hypothetical protein GY804_09385 [Alphaproteobacteria bacterium]|nr:hypothetical protein [Alphaproteobacteria bacterium]